MMSRKRFHNEEEAEWAKRLEENVDLIRAEMLGVLKESKGLWINPHPDYVAGNQWKTFELVFFGLEVKENLSKCPETHKLLKTIPELVTADFSVLPPHTDILPHKGYSKMITRCHLPLVVPNGDLGIEVDGEVRVWEEGKMISFDDSLPHHAWNHTDEVRVVMMIDVPSSNYSYSADEICRYKIENMDDPFLLQMASKEKWLEMYGKKEFNLN